MSAVLLVVLLLLLSHDAFIAHDATMRCRRGRRRRRPSRHRSIVIASPERRACADVVAIAFAALRATPHACDMTTVLYTSRRVPSVSPRACVRACVVHYRVPTASYRVLAIGACRARVVDWSTTRVLVCDRAVRSSIVNVHGRPCDDASHARTSHRWSDPRRWSDPMHDRTSSSSSSSSSSSRERRPHSAAAAPPPPPRVCARAGTTGGWAWARRRLD